MPTPTVTADWKFKLTIGAAVAVIASIATGVWYLSKRDSKIDATAEALIAHAMQDAEERKALREELKVVGTVATDVAEIKGYLKAMRKPVFQTSRDVNALGYELAKLNRSLHPFQSVLEGPLTQN